MATALQKKPPMLLKHWRLETTYFFDNNETIIL